MDFALYLLATACVYALVIHNVAVGSEPFSTQTVKTVWNLKILTRRAHRWNELTEVPEQRPYVGYRQAYLENRSGVYYLFDLVPVYFRFYRVEIAMNDIIRIMTIGDRLDGKSLDTHFPDYLAFGAQLGKASRIRCLPLAGCGV